MIPFTLKATNSKLSKTIELTRQTSHFICEYTGLNPIPAVLSTQTVYNRDGARFNQARADVRNVVLDISVLKDAYLVRQHLYEIFKIGDYIDFEFENLNGKKYFGGYVESFEFNQFEAPSGSIKQPIQISILCPDPWLYGDEIVIPFTTAGADVPGSGKTLTVLGDAETGFKFSWSMQIADDQVTLFTIRGDETERDRQCDIAIDTDLTEFGGEFFMNTEKRIVTYTPEGGDETDLMPYWQHGNQFPVFYPGQNYLYYYGTFGAGTISYKPKYQGV